MNASTQVQTPPRTTPTAVLWLMAAVVTGGTVLLASAPAEPPAAMALASVEMPQLHGSAAHRVAVIATAAQAGSTRAKAAVPSTTDTVYVAALQAP